MHGSSVWDAVGECVSVFEFGRAGWEMFIALLLSRGAPRDHVRDVATM